MSEATPGGVKRREAQPLDARLSQLLIREIVANRYPPGSWLREIEIAGRHEVSRASVREALRHVANAGFVEIIPFRGARVAEVTPEQLLDIFAMLELNYALCARWAAARRAPDDLRDLRHRLDRLTEAVAARADQDELDTLAFRFGDWIGRHCGSGIAFRHLVQVGRLALWQQRLLTASTHDISERSLAAHRLLESAIAAQQVDVAAHAAAAIVAITRATLPGRITGR